MALIEKKLTLEKVIGTELQIGVLYEILKRRTHNISNKVLPFDNQHREFVRKHPYRAWYLVKLDFNYIGTAYVMKNNCIGISLISNVDKFSFIVDKIIKKHKPLKEIKSIRPSYFYLNIAPDNKEVEQELIKMGAQRIQLTFALVST